MVAQRGIPQPLPQLHIMYNELNRENNADSIR
jgi:hypothetical protein